MAEGRKVHRKQSTGTIFRLPWGNHLVPTSYVCTTDMAISSTQPLLNHLAALVRCSPAHQTPPLPKAPRQGDMCLAKRHLTEAKLTENGAFHVRNFTLEDSDVH